MTILAKLAAIYAFFSYVGTGAMFSVFGTYIVIFFFINLVLDSFTRHKRTADQLTYSGIYAVVFLIGIAIAFGTLFYGQVTTKLGGARPQTVLIGLSDEARKALPASIAPAASQLLHGKLIHQTASHTYVEVSGHTVRLRAADVIALVVELEPERQFWSEYFLQKRSGTMIDRGDR